jgi:hypothetical protein
MESLIRFRIKKDLDNSQHKSILALKGSIISKGYTDIIHISDDGEEFHINSFSLLTSKKAAVTGYIMAYIEAKKLEQVVTIS